MSEPPVGNYYCHVCWQVVSPAAEPAAEIKCPSCDSGFVEEMAAGGPAIDGGDDDAGPDRPRSLWAPILLGMVGPRSRRDRDREFDAGGRRRSSAILWLLQGLHDDSTPESPWALESTGAIDTGGPFGDYFVGPGLDMLLQHLSDSDASRYGTPPAKREAVDAMPTVAVDESGSCSVCLEDFGRGAGAKEMPCKHKFHGACILPWLEAHSSCPVCRYRIPTDESRKASNASSS